MRSVDKTLVRFLVLLFVVSLAVQLPIVLLDAEVGGWILLIMWSPGIAALASKWSVDRSVKRMGWGWGAARDQLLAYTLPPVVILVVYGGSWASGVVALDAQGYGARIAKEFGLSDPLSMPGALALLATVGFLANCVAVAREEIGWRGLLLPALHKRWGFLWACLATGAVWAVWHYPGILWGGYNAGGPVGLSLVCFSVMIVSLSVIMGWLRLKTGSLWSAVVLHASHNLFLQAVFDPLTRLDDKARLLTTEWGVGLASGYALLAGGIFLSANLDALGTVSQEMEMDGRRGRFARPTGVEGSPGPTSSGRPHGAVTTNDSP